MDAWAQQSRDATAPGRRRRGGVGVQPAFAGHQLEVDTSDARVAMRPSGPRSPRARTLRASAGSGGGRRRESCVIPRPRATCTSDSRRIVPIPRPCCSSSTMNAISATPRLADRVVLGQADEPPSTSATRMQWRASSAGRRFKWTAVSTGTGEKNRKYRDSNELCRYRSRTCSTSSAHTGRIRAGPPSASRTSRTWATALVRPRGHDGPTNSGSCFQSTNCTARDGGSSRRHSDTPMVGRERVRHQGRWSRSSHRTDRTFGSSRPAPDDRCSMRWFEREEQCHARASEIDW